MQLFLSGSTQLCCVIWIVLQCIFTASLLHNLIKVGSRLFTWLPMLRILLLTQYTNLNSQQKYFSERNAYETRYFWQASLLGSRILASKSKHFCLLMLAQKAFVPWIPLDNFFAIITLWTYTLLVIFSFIIFVYSFKELGHFYSVTVYILNKAVKFFED